MKHDWREVPRTIAQFMEPEQRRCQRCGVIQTRVEEHLWMRLVRRYWTPKVGRCK